MPGLVVLIVVVVVALVAVGAYYAYQKEKQRREALALLANRLGWRYSPRRFSGANDRFRHFSAFQQGHTRFAYNLLMGRFRCDPGGDAIALPATAGDYHYQITTSTGKSTTTHTYQFSFLLLRLPDGVARDLEIRAEHLGDKLMGGLGFDDIDFESAEFSNKFFVKGPDKRFAYDLVHPKMMEFLLGSKPRSIAIRGGYLLLTDGVRRWKPQGFESQLSWLRQFLAHWPRHLELV